MSVHDEDVPLVVRQTISDWVRRKASGTIQLSFHKGKVKTITPAEVMRVEDGQPERSESRTGSGRLRVPHKLV